MNTFSKAVKIFSILILFLPQVSLYSQNPDIRILRSLNSSQTLASDNFFKFISNSDAYLVAGTPLFIGGLGLIKHDDKLFRNACVILSAIVVNTGVTNALKYSIKRERPFVTYPDIFKKSNAGSPSFPSGHTSSAFATATSVSLDWPKWYIIVPTFAWASTVGYSRMHLGVHYPSDVLAGAMIGAGSAWLTHAVNTKLINNSKKKPCDCPNL